MDEDAIHDEVLPRRRSRLSHLLFVVSAVALFQTLMGVIHSPTTQQSRRFEGRALLRTLAREAWEFFSSPLQYRKEWPVGTPTLRQIEEALTPLESKCFTYLPIEWTEGNATLSKPFIFQWCYKGRATIVIDKGRSQQDQIDLGTNRETVVSLEPISPAGKHKKTLFPAIVQRFSTGQACPAKAGAMEEKMTELEKEEGSVKKRGEGRGADGAAGDRADLAISAGVTVHLWCCGFKGGGKAGERGREAEIVNLVRMGRRGGRAMDGGDEARHGAHGRTEKVFGGNARSGAGNDCPQLVASVCTYLLCPVYRESNRAMNWNYVDVVNGQHQKPPPPTFVSRHSRGFKDYDRRQTMSSEERLKLKEEVREMFVHAYDGYMEHAFPGGELMPVSCTAGQLHLVKLPYVTLVDTLDTLAILGNASEFRRAVGLVSRGLDLSVDVSVSVFESNIRLLGGLLSAHLLAIDPAMGLYSRVRGRRYGADEASGIVRDRNSGHCKNVGDGGCCCEESCDSGSNSGSSREGGVRSSSNTQARKNSAGRERTEGRGSGDGGRDVNTRGKGRCESISGRVCVEERFALEDEEEDQEDQDEGEDAEEEMEVYNGELLELAEELGRRLLPAFRTATGIPYGTVNLQRGVPIGETKIASLAGAGSLTMEFSILSALTGDGVFAKAAEGAVKALFDRRSASFGLLGKHIDTKSGSWTETESGIGTNGDSFFEYLLKMYVLWDDVRYWDMFMQTYSSAQRFMREGDWYASVDIAEGFVTFRTFDNLMAFWPGMQALLGDVSLASRTLNAFYLIWRDSGFLPEQFDHARWNLHAHGGGRAYPLRPELIESTLMVYRATGDTSWLWAGRDVLTSLQTFCRTKCGYAGVLDVGAMTLDEQMPSFFLSETLKYLYLLFDEENFIHKGNYVFSTEAHPFSIEAVRRGGGYGNDGAEKPGFSAADGGRDASRTRGESTTFLKSRRLSVRHNVAPSLLHPWPTMSVLPTRLVSSAGFMRAGARARPRRDIRGSDGSSVKSSVSTDRRKGVWAKWRSSVGSRHPVGPETWRDVNILFWAKGAGGLDKHPKSSVEMRTELVYTNTLWKMYMERTCPVFPWWLAPYRYSPTTFADTLTVGGRSVWPFIITAGLKVADGVENDHATLRDGSSRGVRQIVDLEGVGAIQVSIADGETTLIHLESGETLEIMHTAAMDGMAGLPGAQESAAAMQVYSYFQPEEEKRTTVPSQSPLHRRAQTRKDGRARSTPIGELETSDDELPEDGVSGVDMPPASAEATPHPVRTFLVTKQGLAVYCTLLFVKDFPCSVATFSPPGNGRAVIPSVSAPLYLLESHGDPYGCDVDVAKAQDSVAPEDDASSAAPAVPATASLGDGVADDDCGGVPAAVPAALHSSADVAASPSSWQAVNPSPGRDTPDDARGGGVAPQPRSRGSSERHGMPYAGNILVVSRGQCTFEQKAAVAQEMGAVGLVVINDQPGGRVFAMPGVIVEEEDAEGGISIPVIMVGMEDGAEIRQALVGMCTVDSHLSQASLDLRSFHVGTRSGFGREREAQKESGVGPRASSSPTRHTATSDETSSNGVGNTASGDGDAPPKNIDGGRTEKRDEDETEEILGEFNSMTRSYLVTEREDSTSEDVRARPFASPDVIIGEDVIHVIGVRQWGAMLVTVDTPQGRGMSVSPAVYGDAVIPQVNDDGRGDRNDEADHDGEDVDDDDDDDDDEWN